MNTRTVDALDNTRDRIRAFIHSMRPLRGVADLAQDDDYQCGRALLERLADSAEGEDYPALRFNTEQCAQVCMYLRSIEPFAPGNWWDDPEGAPSHTCGFQFVVGAIADSLRDPGDRQDAEIERPAEGADTSETAAPTLKSIKERIEAPTDERTSATTPPERTESDASTRNLDMSLQLQHVHATLNLLQTVARSKDAFADLETLCTSTLDNALDGAMREIERVNQFIDGLPCSAPAILLQAIVETERLAESAGKDKEQYQRILEQMARAHADLKAVRSTSTTRIRGEAYGEAALRSIGAIGAAIAATKRLYWDAPKGSDEKATYKEAVEQLEAALDYVETDFVETAQPVGTG
jgi:hypothetical protein